MSKRIISVSYKDDTPAFFSEEFFADYAAGYRDINTKYGTMHVSLRPEDVFCFVFWTKNPSDHFLKHIDDLKSPFYVQWTITGYGKDIEKNIPDKDIVMQRFKTLSERIGKSRCVWRYDPILMAPGLEVDWHVKRFEEMAANLEGYTGRCVISFMDSYAKINKECVRIGMRPPTYDEIQKVSESIAKSAARHGMTVQTCAERKYDLRRYGIVEGACIDGDYIEHEFGVELPEKNKKPGTFRPCLCILNTDIGSYHRCKHGCEYCYAK